MNSPRNPASSLAGAIALALLAGGASPVAAQIQVDVNGRAVSFGAVGPQRIDGRVLIPLRAVVEALGAEVEWDRATQTVLGRKGEREFTLPIGSRTATVNRSTVDLDVPAQLIRGNTMVPLRFVAEALGADVDWNAATQQVAISNRGGDGSATAGPRDGEDRERDDRSPRTPRTPRNADAVGVFGEVVAVRSRGRRSTLTVQTRTGREAFELSRAVEISRTAGRQASRRVTVADLQAGDRVRLSRNADGMVTRVEARAASGNAADSSSTRSLVSGELTAVRSGANPPSVIVLVGGRRVTLEVTRETDIYRASAPGRTPSRAQLDDLQPGDDVRIRTDATGLVAQVIDVEVAR